MTVGVFNFVEVFIDGEDDDDEDNDGDDDVMKDIIFIGNDT